MPEVAVAEKPMIDGDKLFKIRDKFRHPGDYYSTGLRYSKAEGGNVGEDLFVSKDRLLNLVLNHETYTRAGEDTSDTHWQQIIIKLRVSGTAEKPELGLKGIAFTSSRRYPGVRDISFAKPITVEVDTEKWLGQVQTLVRNPEINGWMKERGLFQEPTGKGQEAAHKPPILK